MCYLTFSFSTLGVCDLVCSTLTTPLSWDAPPFKGSRDTCGWWQPRWVCTKNAPFSIFGLFLLKSHCCRWTHFSAFVINASDSLSAFSESSSLLSHTAGCSQVVRHLHKFPTTSPKGAPACLALWMRPLFYTPIFCISMVYVPGNIPRQPCPFNTHPLSAPPPWSWVSSSLA